MKSIAFFQAHLAPAVFAVVLFTSCSFADGAFTSTKTEPVTVFLPDYPEDRPPLAAWLLVREKNGMPIAEVLAKDTKSATLVFDKNRFAPVLFFPLNTGQDSKGGAAYVSFFKPGGCIYPFSHQATWDGGFGAQLLLDLLTKPNDQYNTAELRSFCERFNWARFQTEVADLCVKDSAFNPWEMDTEKLVTSLASGKFSKTRLKAAVKTVTVGGTNGFAGFFQTYVPAVVLTAKSGEFTFGYNAVGENIVFDGTTVFLICPPSHPGTTGGTNYRLALMPPPLYTQ
jgi:hypothetical protein